MPTLVSFVSVFVVTVFRMWLFPHMLFITKKLLLSFDVTTLVIHNTNDFLSAFIEKVIIVSHFFLIDALLV